MFVCVSHFSPIGVGFSPHPRKFFSEDLPCKRQLCGLIGFSVSEIIMDYFSIHDFNYVGGGGEC